MTDRPSSWLAPCLLVVVGLSTGCASSDLARAERLFAANELERARVLYERVGDRPAALYKLAVVHSLRGDGEGVRSLLERLVTLHPRHPYGRAGRVWLERIAAADAAERELAQARQRLETLDAALRRIGAESRAHADARSALDRRLGERDVELQRARAQLAETRERVEELEAKVETLSRELERLKAIDLQERPPNGEGHGWPSTRREPPRLR